MCARHIYARWGKIHQGKELRIQLWKVVRSTSKPKIHKELENMCKLKEGVKAVEELLDRWPISSWCQVYFNDMVECEVIDNNMCETFNKMILQSRSKPIITMLEDIRQYVMTRIVAKGQYAMKWKTIYGPNIVGKIEKEKKKCSKWQLKWNEGVSHEVFGMT